MRLNAVIDGNLVYGSSGADGIYIINYGVGGGNPTWNTDGNIEYRTQDLNAVISNNVILWQRRRGSFGYIRQRDKIFQQHRIG